MSMVGSLGCYIEVKLSNYYYFPGFEKVYDEKLRRNVRQCSLCNTKIKNVSTARLNAHRLKCSGIKRSSSSVDKWIGN